MDTVTSTDLVVLPEVPVLTGVQAQGDLLILPWPVNVDPARRAREVALAKPVAGLPVVVLTGDNGHDHALSPSPGVAWCSYPKDRQTLGVLVVDDQAVAVLGHIEHGDSHIGPGVYVIRRQREWADQVRMVAD